MVREDHRDFMRREDADGGWTALHLAAHYGHEAVVKRLLEAGAALNVRARNGIGNTPLMAAVAGGSVSIVKQLLAAGADIGVRDAGGHDAVELASSEGRAEILAVLRQDCRR
jgi:ankyrin repeat protein